jgi:hypothetical protein
VSPGGKSGEPDPNPNYKKKIFKYRWTVNRATKREENLKVKRIYVKNILGGLNQNRLLKVKK